MSVSAEVGDSVNLTCNGTGLGELQVTWNTTAANQNLLTPMEMFGTNTITSILYITGVSVSEGGDYTCELSNEAGSTSETTTLYIIPNIISQPANISTEAGVNRSLECLAVGFPEPSYHWEKRDEEGDGMRTGGDELMEVFIPVNVTTRELVFEPVRYSDFGIYRCVASNAAGTDASEPATVTGNVLI